MKQIIENVLEFVQQLSSDEVIAYDNITRANGKYLLAIEIIKTISGE